MKSKIERYISKSLTTQALETITNKVNTLPFDYSGELATGKDN